MYLFLIHGRLMQVSETTTGEPHENCIKHRR